MSEYDIYFGLQDVSDDVLLYKILRFIPLTDLVLNVVYVNRTFHSLVKMSVKNQQLDEVSIVSPVQGLKFFQKKMDENLSKMRKLRGKIGRGVYSIFDRNSNLPQSFIDETVNILLSQMEKYDEESVLTFKVFLRLVQMDAFDIKKCGRILVGYLLSFMAVEPYKTIEGDMCFRIIKEIINRMSDDERIEEESIEFKKSIFYSISTICCNPWSSELMRYIIFERRDKFRIPNTSNEEWKYLLCAQNHFLERYFNCLPVIHIRQDTFKMVIEEINIDGTKLLNAIVTKYVSFYNQNKHNTKEKIREVMKKKFPRDRIRVSGKIVKTCIRKCLERLDKSFKSDETRRSDEKRGLLGICLDYIRILKTFIETFGIREYDNKSFSDGEEEIKDLDTLRTHILDFRQFLDLEDVRERHFRDNCYYRSPGWEIRDMDEWKIKYTELSEYHVLFMDYFAVEKGRERLFPRLYRLLFCEEIDTKIEERRKARNLAFMEKWQKEKLEEEKVEVENKEFEEMEYYEERMFDYQSSLKARKRNKRKRRKKI